MTHVHYFVKWSSAILLFLFFSMTWQLNAQAQVDMDQFDRDEARTIQLYLAGELNNPTIEDRNVISRYYDGLDNRRFGAPILPPPLTSSNVEEIIAYWNQNSNNLPGGGFGFLADPSVFPQAADAGSGFLAIGGGIITETEVNSNGDTVYSWVPSFGGTTINAQGEDGSGGSIAFQGGTDNGNNGAYMQLEISMEGFEDLNISYATRGTSTGFDTQTLSWSTDGTNFTDFATVEDTNVSSFFLVEESVPADVNGAETVYLRITFDGASSNTGNNRVDNIVLAATPADDSGNGNDVALYEDFSNEIFPPTGWTTFKDGNDDTWDWSRDTNQFNSEPASALRRWSSGASGFQDDWLVSPAVTIGSDRDVLEFADRVQFPFDYDFSGVYVSTGSGDPADGDFVEIFEINPTPSIEWRANSIELGDYEGETIYIAFRYTGTFAHSWWIDDVLVFTPPPTPLPVALLSPANEAEDLDLFTTLEWAVGNGVEPDVFNVYFGTDPDPEFVGTITETSWDTPMLDWNTTYYWYVIAENDGGESDPSAVWSFTTMEDPLLAAPFDVDLSEFPPENWTRPFGVLSEETEFTTPVGSNWIGSNFNNDAANEPGTRINLWNEVNRWLMSHSFEVDQSAAQYELMFDVAVTNWDTNNAAQLGPEDYFAVVFADGYNAGMSAYDEVWSSDNVVFELSGADGDELEAGGQTFVVPLDGIEGDVRMAFYAERLSGANPDIDLHLANIRIVASELTVDTDMLEFESIFVGQTATLSFDVTNTGVGTMTVVAESDSPDFIVDDAPVSIAAGDSFEYTVTFDPSDSGSFSGNITLDAGETATVSVSGMATNPPVVGVDPEEFVVGTIPDQGSVTRNLAIANNGLESALDFVVGVNLSNGSELASTLPETITWEKRGEQIEQSVRAIRTPFPSVRAYSDGDVISFEESEGFELGFIGGQSGWATFSNNTTQPRISDERATDGDWSLALSNHEGLGTGANIGAFSPLFALNDAIALVEQDIFIEATGGADYNVVLQSDSQDALLARVVFTWTGSTFVVDSPDGTPVFVNANTSYPVGEWFTLGIESNSVTQTINYYIDGELFYSGNLFGATSPEQIIYLHDNWNAGESGFIDNVRITTEEALWLSVAPDFGEIAAGSDQDVTLFFDSTLPIGTYNAELVVLSNDPDNSSVTVPVEFTVFDTAQVQLIHNAADPALAEVDVYVNGELFASSFPFRAATDFIAIPAEQELLVEVTAPDETEVLISLETTPEVGEVFTIIAQGVADPDDFASNPAGADIAAELVFVEDRQTEAPDDETVSFYVFHGATDAPNVDIFVRELNSNILTDVPYGAASDYFDVEEGTYAIEVRPTGSTNPAAVFTADLQGLGGSAAGILASGFLNPMANQGGEQFALAVVLDNGTVVTLDGVFGPELVVSPDELNFGQVAVGFDRTIPVTFTNAGAANLALLDVEFDNDAYSTDFDEADLLLPGASVTYMVTFTPDVVGDYDAEMTISSNDSDSPKVISISGSGVLPSTFVVNPTEIEATLDIGETGQKVITISNPGDGDLHFAFPGYAMANILDGANSDFDSIRDMVVTPVRSAFENTEDNRAATMNRLMSHNYNAGSILNIANSVNERSNQRNSSVMSGDWYTIDFESLTLPGGNFITVASGLEGELTSVNPDFSIEELGGTWANDFAVLFTTEPLEEGEVVDPETVVLQVGGFTQYGPTGTRVAWAEGGSGEFDVFTPVEIDPAVDVSGLYVSIGNGWTTSGGGTWSGSVELIGVSVPDVDSFITVVDPISGVVAPGESETITLTLDATDLFVGEYSTVLNVETNDPLRPNVEIPATLTVDGNPPTVALNPDSFDVEVTSGEADVTRTLTVTNEGDAPLDFVLGLDLDPTNERRNAQAQTFEYEKRGVTQTLSTSAVRGVFGASRAFNDGGIISFEEEDGFSPGFIGGQMGWGTITNNTMQPAVSSDRASHGIWSLEIDEHEGLAPGSNVAAFSPLFMVDEDFMSFSFDVYIEATGGADYDVIIQSPAQELLTARVKFDFAGNVRLVDVNAAGTIAFVDTGEQFPVDEWFELTINVDRPEEAIYYYMNGERFWEGVMFGANIVEGIVLIADNWNDGEKGFFDNIRTSTDTDSPWLTLSENAGSLLPGESMDITLAFDSTIDAGTYFANIVVESNDPVNGLVNIPVTYNVGAPVEVGSIAELLAIAEPNDGVTYTLTNEVYLVFTSNFRGRKVVVDGTGAILVDDPGDGVLSKEYNRYDGITGLTFTFSNFFDTLQIIPVADAGDATSEDNVVLPRRAIIPDLGIADQSELVVIEDVTFVQQGDFANQTTYTIVDGAGNELPVRTDRIVESILMDDEETYIGTPIPADPVTVVGYISIFQGNPQLVIRKLGDFYDPTAVGAFSLTSPPNDAEVPLVPGSDNPVSVTWEAAAGDDMEYMWFANASGLPLMVPALAIETEDPGFTVSEGDLVGIIESLFGEVEVGDSFTLDWAVFAANDTGARHSNEIWTVTFVISEEVEPVGENVTFAVNMNFQQDEGVFQPEVGDQVFVRGSFNDWSAVEGQEMVDDGTGVFTVTLFVEGEAETEHAYKYFMLAGDGRDLPNGGWEVNGVGPVGDNGDRQLVLVGEDQELDPVFFNNEDGVNINDGEEMPQEFALRQNYPNPFNPTTQIQFALPEAIDVRLDVYNVMGQRVATLVNGHQNAGYHTVTFDASRLASGVYLYRIQAGSFVQVEKMMLVK